MKGTLSGRLHPTPVQQWKPSLFRLQGWDSSSSQGDWRESSRHCFSFVSFNIMPMLCWSTAILVLSVQFSSVTQLCPTLCDPMDCSMPASLSIIISRSVLKLMSTESVMPSNISCSVVPFSSHPQSFLESGTFQMRQLFASGGQSVSVSASASVLPMNT